jgi:membrane-bound metal-dependent hydrolase YbcI (DUF457 family)
MISALLPDIDLKNSKARLLMDVGMVIVVCFAVLLNGCNHHLCIPSFASLPSMAFLALAILGCYFLFFLLMNPKHRGITHSLVACLVYCFLVFIVLGRFFAAAALIGYLSHILADGVVKTF